MMLMRTLFFSILLRSGYSFSTAGFGSHYVAVHSSFIRQDQQHQQYQQYQHHQQHQQYQPLYAIPDSNNVRPGSMDYATQKLGRVPYGEASRKYRQTVYSHSDWLNHRSNDRLVGSLVSMFYSGVVRQVKNKILWVASVAIFVTFWDDFLVNFIAENVNDPNINLPHLCLPTIPFLLSSPALGLLLVFRTNASYQRWLEGVRLWGTIKSHSKNIVRMSTTFTSFGDNQQEDKQNEELLNELALSVWILSRSIMNRLMGNDDENEYKKQLSQMENQDNSFFVNRLFEEDDRSNVALMELSLVLDSIPVDEKRRCEIDKSVIILSDALVSCDRIFNSPVPLVYTRHTARFLSLWILLVPLAIHDEFVRVEGIGILTIPTAAVLALFLFGIEELAVQLEEPFSILPLQKYCNEIQQSTTKMINWTIESRNMKNKTIQQKEEIINNA